MDSVLGFDLDPGGRPRRFGAAAAFGSAFGTGTGSAFGSGSGSSRISEDSSTIGSSS